MTTVRETLTLMGEGAVASCGAAIISNPFEMMKTRLQLQGELRRKGDYPLLYRGMIHGMYRIARVEGAWALQKGLFASFGHQITQNGTRLGLYPPIQRFLQSLWNCDPGLAVNIVAGLVAGLTGAVVSSPFFLVKVRLHAQANRSCAQSAVGHQHHYSGVWDALRTIYRERGVRGLYHGTVMICWRTGVGSAAQLAAYDSCKICCSQWSSLPTTDPRVHIAASLGSAVAIVISTNPLEVLMTRSYNNDKHAYSANVPASLMKIVRIEGFEGLYKGSTALYCRMAPHTIFTFLFLEQLRGRRRTPDDIMEAAVEV